MYQYYKLHIVSDMCVHYITHADNLRDVTHNRESYRTLHTTEHPV